MGVFNQIKMIWHKREVPQLTLNIFVKKEYISESIA